MAVYNNRVTVQAAVESIRQQTFENWRFVIIDDASTDGTREVLDSIARSDNRITILRNDRNRGLAASLNVGWHHAHTELIARMDADDLSLPPRLEKQLEFMSSHPEVSVLGTGIEILRPDCGLSLNRFRPETHAELCRRIYFENPFFHPTVMYRKKFLESLGGYDETFRRAQDYDLWFRGYRQHVYHNLSEPLVRYRASFTPTMQSVWYNSKVVCRAAVRDREIALGAWSLTRLAAGAALSRLRAFNSKRAI